MHPCVTKKTWLHYHACTTIPKSPPKIIVQKSRRLCGFSFWNIKFSSPKWLERIKGEGATKIVGLAYLPNIYIIRHCERMWSNPAFLLTLQLNAFGLMLFEWRKCHCGFIPQSLFGTSFGVYDKDCTTSARWQENFRAKTEWGVTLSHAIFI